MNDAINLDLTSLRKAIHSLDEAVRELAKHPNNLFVRDATIQRFEYSYELTHKMLKRYLEMTEANTVEIDQMNFSFLIRTGAEKGLLQNSWDQWSIYRTARNLTSHTYNEKKAVEVCQVIPKFLHEATFFLEQLQSRLGS